MEIHQVTEDSEYFPPLLRELAKPPQKLYIRGNLELLSSDFLVAVVGSRRANAYGKQCVERLFSPLVSAGIPLVSGLAYGIDALAHKICLAHKQPTIAVLGSGVDDASIYPRQHISLAHHILEADGVLLSEYEPGTPAYPGQFPARNRIVAGLAQATIVVQAAKRSGSLITARLALDANREVGAVPGPITDPLSAGTNQLIVDGAQPITSSENIFHMLGLEMATAHEQSVAQLTNVQHELLHTLSSTPRHVDTIIAELKWPSEQVTSVLTELELLGIAEHVGAMKYINRVS